MRDKLSLLWRKISEPAASVVGHETRQKARFIASIYLIMLPLGMMLLLAAGIMQHSWGILSDNDFVVMLPAACIWLAAYFLSRQGRYKLSALVSICVAFVGILLGAAFDEDGSVQEIAFLLFPILLSSIIFDYRVTTVLVGISLLFALAFPFINPSITFLDAIAGPITFLLIGFVMILLSNFHRDRMERIRRERLIEFQDSVQKLLKSSNERIDDKKTISHEDFDFTNLLELLTEHRRTLEIERFQYEDTMHFRALFEYANDAVFLMDLDTNFLAANPRAEEMLGYSQNEILSKKPTDFILPEEIPDSYKRVLKNLLDGEVLEPYERTFIHKEGHKVPAELNISVIYDKSGEPKFIQSIARDLTERKRAQGELLQLRKAVQTSGEVIFITDSDGVFTYVNPEFTSQYGYAPEEVIGKATPRILKSGERSLADYQTFWQQLQDKAVVKQEYRNRRKDGSLVDVETTTNAILEKDEIVGFIVIQSDVTNRKKAQTDLELSEARYRAVVQDEVDLISRYNLDGTLTFVNNAYANFFGVDPVDIIGKTHASFLGEERVAYLEDLRHRLSPEEPVSIYEAKHEIPNGKIVWIQWANRLILDDNDTPLEYQAVGTDITELKLVQEALSKTERDYRSVFEGAHDAIVIMTPGEQIILDANQHAFDMYGYSREELVGKSLKGVTKDTQQGKTCISNVHSEGTVNRFTSIHLDKAGNEINVEANASTIEYQEKTAILGIIRDVTEQVQAKNALQRRAQELESLYTSSQATGRLLPQDELFQLVHQEVRKFIPVDIFGIVLWYSDFEEFELGLVYEGGKYQPEMAGCRLSKEQGSLSGWVVEKQRSLLINDFDGERLPAETQHISGDMPKAWLGVPILVGERVLGVMTVQSLEPNAFSKPDQTYLELLGAQLGTALENSRLYAAELHQAKELERANQLIDTLSRISARMSETNVPEAVFSILGEELKSFQMGCTVFLLESDHQATRLAYSSLSSRLINKVEEWSGVQLLNRRTPRSIWTPNFEYLFDTGQPFYVDDFSQSLVGYFPDVTKSVLRPTLRLVGINQETAAIVLPLAVRGELFGAIAVWGQDIREGDMHPFSVFASQIAGVFENARLYEAESLQADSLERSNAMLTALNDVAARISSTFDPDVVLETLGSSLKQLQLESIIALVDPKDRSIYYRYHSLDFALLRQAEKLAGGTLLGYRMPMQDLPPILVPLFRERQALFAPNLPSLGTSLFSKAPSIVIEKGMQLAGITQDTSAIFLPLEVDGHVIGFIGVWGENLQQADVPTFSIFANQVASAFENARLYEAEQRQIERLKALRTIDQAIASSHDEHTVFEVVLEQVATQLAVDAAAILLLRPSTNVLEFVAGCGLRSNAIQTSSIPISDNGLGHAGFDRKLIQLPDISHSKNGFKNDERLESEDVVAYYAAPLIVDHQIKGMLEVYHRQVLNPDDEWLDFLETLAGQAAIALDNTQLFDSLQQSNTSLVQAYNATLEGWAKALELRDNETEGHSQRVTEMVVRLSRHLGLTEEAIVEVRRGALLHDIGKMGIPDSILHKPGPLDDEEWEIMRQHPVHAFELLSRIPYLSAALDIPYCHHEKWNGGGYPRGLEGEQIPLPARIFSVIDVYDALTSDRPYRDAWPQEKTLAYIAEESGRHFDPVVVDAFIQMMEADYQFNEEFAALPIG